MISLYQALGRRRPAFVIGPVLLAATLATGCSAASSPAASPSSAPGRPGSASFRQCLQSHGLKLPASRPSPGSGQPHVRPTGSAASAFRKALQACGGGFGGGSGQAG